MIPTSTLTVLLSILTDKRETEFSLPSCLAFEIKDFLGSYTKVGTLLSDKLTTSTGSPQDCVFSLMLFIRCTNTTTTSVNLLHDGKEQHGPDPDRFIKCCEVRPCSQHSKDFRGQQSSQPTITKQLIQSVTEYQYLGVILDHM